MYCEALGKIVDKICIFRAGAQASFLPEKFKCGQKELSTRS